MSIPETIQTLADHGLLVNPLRSLADLPATFPNVERPRFLCGDRVRWTSDGETTDWGVAIGQFYSFDPFCGRWQWSYLIWLDAESPSAAWVKADIALEEDLEPCDGGAVNVPSGSEAL